MKKALEEFKIPQDVKEFAKKYNRFKIKNFLETSVGKFYVDSEVRYLGCIVHPKSGNGYNPILDRIVNNTIEYIRFSKLESQSFEQIDFIFETVEDLLKELEPIKEVKKDFKLKIKIGKLEIYWR